MMNRLDMSLASQRHRVVEYLKVNGSISTSEAWEILGVSRLAARIFELRERGYEIYTERRKVVDVFGFPHSGMAVYYLISSREAANDEIY